LHLALGCVSAAVIVALLQMSMRPIIEQCVSWPAIKAANGAIGTQYAQIADAAYIAHHPGRSRRTEHRGVKCRHQRRALPACRDVAAAKIGDDVDTAQFCEQRGVVGLARVSPLRPMADGLAMHADRTDFTCL